MLSSTQILKYDPLVSDSACHIRAPYLVTLAQKAKNKTLSKEEETFLTQCDTLTESKIIQYDKFKIIIDERTDLKKISELLPPNASNTKKQSALAKIKSEVASTSLKALITVNNDMTIDVNDQAYSANIVTSGQKIPIIPLYYSAKMMLNYAAKLSIPIVANVKRIRPDDQYYVLDGAASITYSYDVNKKTFIPQEMKEDQEVIAIDMVNCYVKGKENEVNGFLTDNNFDSFIDAFKQLDFATLFMICAVGHSQYPASKDKAKENKSLYFLNIPVSDEKEKTPEKIYVDIKNCSEKEYKQLYSLAGHYGFFRKNGAIYNQADKKNPGKLIRPLTCLFFIDHVRASTIEQCRRDTVDLMKQQKTLMAEKEEDIESGKKV